MLTKLKQQALSTQIARFSRGGLWQLQFPEALESQFELDRRSLRSMRLWREGLVSIVVFNVFYIGEWMVAKTTTTRELLLQMGVVTPLSLLVNQLMRRQPPAWLREGSIAAMTCVIGCVYLYLQHGKEPVHVAFAQVGAMVTAMFASVVMRLRFPYALTVSVVITAATMVFVVTDHGLTWEQKFLGASLTTIAIGIGMMSNYSLEREERLGYLRYLHSERQNQEVSAMNARLELLSTIDNLTGLANRRAYEARFEEMWAEAETTRAPLSMLVMDVDHFKVLNDVRGHLYGDDVLRRVSSLLSQGLRSRADFAARFGGEEFVVLLPDTTQESAELAAERIRKLVELAGSPTQEQLTNECLMWVTISCGVSTCYSTEGRRKEDLLEAADKAMYRAKSEGRNRVCYRPLKPTGEPLVERRDQRVTGEQPGQ